ncbi:hypothetical protein CS542_06530 [Pedobacter sp. IW39]|nr:hypothetical protein CS542_06530 [Pedobacter sp. IW39]
MNALIETGTAKVNALPESAIADFAGKKYIFIETGQRKDEKAEVNYHFQLLEIAIGSADADMLKSDFLKALILLPEGGN